MAAARQGIPTHYITEAIPQIFSQREKMKIYGECQNEDATFTACLAKIRDSKILDITSQNELIDTIQQQEKINNFYTAAIGSGADCRRQYGSLDKQREMCSQDGALNYLKTSTDPAALAAYKQANDIIFINAVMAGNNTAIIKHCEESKGSKSLCSDPKRYVNFVLETKDNPGELLDQQAKLRGATVDDFKASLKDSFTYQNDNSIIPKDPAFSAGRLQQNLEMNNRCGSAGYYNSGAHACVGGVGTNGFPIVTPLGFQPTKCSSGSTYDNGQCISRSWIGASITKPGCDSGYSLGDKGLCYNQNPLKEIAGSQINILGLKFGECNEGYRSNKNIFNSTCVPTTVDKVLESSNAWWSNQYIYDNFIALGRQSNLGTLAVNTHQLGANIATSIENRQNRLCQDMVDD